MTLYRESLIHRKLSKFDDFSQLKIVVRYVLRISYAIYAGCAHILIRCE